jgi:hypothetical protein
VPFDTHVHSQHTLAPEDVLGLLCQQVPHEHVEPVLVKRAASNNANAANTTQVVQLLAAALGAALTLHDGTGDMTANSSMTSAQEARGSAGGDWHAQQAAQRCCKAGLQAEPRCFLLLC